MVQTKPIKNANEKATEINIKINYKSLHESNMKDLNNLDITIKRCAVLRKVTKQNTYITVNGLKNFITASFISLTEDSSSPKS